MAIYSGSSTSVNELVHKEGTKGLTWIRSTVHNRRPTVDHRITDRLMPQNACFRRRSYRQISVEIIGMGSYTFSTNILLRQDWIKVVRIRKRQWLYAAKLQCKLTREYVAASYIT